MNWPTRKLTVVTGGNVSSGVGQTEVSGGSLPPAMMIQRPELRIPAIVTGDSGRS